MTTSIHTKIRSYNQARDCRSGPRIQGREFLFQGERAPTMITLASKKAAHLEIDQSFGIAAQRNHAYSHKTKQVLVYIFSEKINPHDVITKHLFWDLGELRVFVS